MKHQLERLPEYADQAMGGLNADGVMKQRILLAAQSQKQETRQRRYLVPALATACTVLLVVGASVGLNHQSVPVSGAIEQATEPVFLLSEQFAGDYSTLMEDNEKPQSRALLDLGNGSLNITAGGSTSYQSIWAPAEGSTFPLIGVNGQYYRLLTSPAEVSSRLLGNSLGTVTEYTSEPALSGSSGIVSNKVSTGTEVYAISGMKGALISAKVNGTYRLFQRVSFNGSALRGSESLADTLQAGGHIVAMKLSGVGIVTDISLCNQLYSTLLSDAVFEGTGSLKASQNLLIQLDSGLVLELAVKNDKISACGTWSCPDFISAFKNAVR